MVKEEVKEVLEGNCSLICQFEEDMKEDDI